MTETDTSLEDRLDQMAQNGLQQWFNNQIQTLPHLSMPPKVLVINDLHAGDTGIGKHVDPLKNSGMEPAVLDLLQVHHELGYSLWTSEVFDIWRAYFLKACEEHHPELCDMLDRFRYSGLLYWADSNHSKDELILAQAYIFEGYNKKFFFFHGHQKDFVNDVGWKIGRQCVRMADELGIDPLSSPHPSNYDRHVAVRQMWKKLADDNPEYTFLCGHSHYQEHNGYWNSGSPVNGKLECIKIEEGEVQLHAV